MFYSMFHWISMEIQCISLILIFFVDFSMDFWTNNQFNWFSLFLVEFSLNFNGILMKFNDFHYFFLIFQWISKKIIEFLWFFKIFECWGPRAEGAFPRPTARGNPHGSSRGRAHADWISSNRRVHQKDKLGWRARVEASLRAFIGRGLISKSAGSLWSGGSGTSYPLPKG